MDVNFHRTGTLPPRYVGKWEDNSMHGWGRREKTHISMENLARCKKNTPGVFFVFKSIFVDFMWCLFFKDVYNYLMSSYVFLKLTKCAFQVVRAVIKIVPKGCCVNYLMIADSTTHFQLGAGCRIPPFV